MSDEEQKGRERAIKAAGLAADILMLLHKCKADDLVAVWAIGSVLETLGKGPKPN